MRTQLNRVARFIALSLSAIAFILPALAADVEPLSAIRGKVVTSDGSPAAFVSVQLKEKNRGTTTNEKGEFVFRRLQAGRYTVQVYLIGYKMTAQEVEVKQDEVTAVSIQLEATDAQLKEVVINGEKNKYKMDNVSGSLRLQTPILNVPQNIQVVSAELLADQQVFDIVDGITRNVSGATRVGHWDNQYAQIRMRGSKIPAFRNGMNIEASWGPTKEDAAVIDRIEFVKGPAGFMLAAGEPGGSYNVVTKKPTGQTRQSASLSMGSFSTYRAALDFDGKLSKDAKWLYRLNVALQDNDYYTKYNYSKRFMIAPVLKYLVDDRTSVTLEYTYQTSTYLGNGNYQFSNKGLLDEGIGNDFFYQDPALEPSWLKDHSVYVYLDHQINDKWKAHAQVAYFNFAMEGNSMWAPAKGVSANGDMLRYYSLGDEAGENTFGQVSLSGEEFTGGIRHRILGGVDMGTKKFWGDFRTLANDVRLAGGAIFNVYNPQYGIPFENLPTLDRTRSVRQRAANSNYISSVNYFSFYLQDELAFFNDALRLTLAGRYTKAQVTSRTKAADKNDDVVTPRVGLSYSITKNTSIYGLYDQSFVPVTGLDSSLKPFDPLKGNNLEFGVKREWLSGRVTTTFAAYRIKRVGDKVNMNIKDSRGADVFEQLGETTSKGLELDITGQIVKGLNVTVNGAITDSKITKESPNVVAGKETVGNITPNTAKYLMNSWVNYNVQQGFLKNFGIQAGTQWQAERSVGATKTSNIPNYFRVDGGLNYHTGKMSIGFLVNNLLDNRKLLTAASMAATPTDFYSYIVEARRNFRMTVTYRF
ncbi:TonB-dependent receptor [Chitinophaga horti]|uniref:TonB-dependent receptor n=1 Tax=Chitinophaga horti TaxID=2920382 RepID=A0ABY6J3R5_9BACT|nr:TonB-dependent receptor [Chitinophaga horti]UYQ94310.1 TonB-dependent receptor [Chitinophaga horti]